MRLPLLLSILLTSLNLQAQKSKQDAILLKDSTMVLGYVNYLSDFILHLETKKSKEDLTFFSDDVDYVMIAPTNYYVSKRLKKEMIDRDSEFNSLMTPEQLFGFKFILGTDTLMSSYRLRKNSDPLTSDFKNYNYDPKGKTFKERIKSVAEKSPLTAALLVLIILL